MKPTDSDIVAAKEKADEVFICEAGKFTFLVKRPMSLPFQNAVNAKDDVRAQALEKLARTVILWPALEEYDKIVSKHVAVPTRIAAFAMQLAAADEEAEAKKA